MKTFSEINDATGFANGEKFTTEEQVKAYFTAQNMDDMFGAPHPIQSDLDEMAALVIANWWHCDFQDEYTFLEDEADSMLGPVTVFRVVATDQIKTMPLADVYGNYGQQYGHDEAGDWMDINTQAGADLLNALAEEEESEKRFAVGDTVEAYDETEFFDHALANGAKGDFELNEVEVKGLTYWDGHNHATIVIDKMDTEMNVRDQVTDREKINLFHRAIEGMEKVREGAGTKTYEYAEGETKIQITESFWQGEWAKYTLELNPEEVEFA